MSKTSKRPGLQAAVGADHLLDTTLLVWKSDRMQRLLEIADSPAFAPRVKRLYYQADRLKQGMTIQEWDSVRHVPLSGFEGDPDPDEILSELPDSDIDGLEGAESDRYQRALRRTIRKWQSTLRGDYTKEQLLDAYQHYCVAVLDQKQVDVHRMDIKCLTTLFERCPRLDHITIALGHGTHGRLDAATFAFEDALCYPYGDPTYTGPMYKQTFDDSLINKAPDSSLAWRKQCFATMRYLRELRLGFDRYIARDESADDIDDTWMQACDYFTDGGPKILLAAAPDLRVLKLRFPHFPTNNRLAPVAYFGDNIGDLSWPKLREFGMTRILAKEDEVVDFLLRHKRTLRRLSLSNITLDQGTWESLFQRIAGEMPKLKKVKLRGSLSEITPLTPLDSVLSDFLAFDGPPGPRKLESRKISPLRDAFENYILHGGEMPMEREELPYEQRVYPWHAEQYSPPGIEDEGYTSDGSVIEYTEDDFDLAI